MRTSVSDRDGQRVIDAILARRSTREGYSARPVTQSDLEVVVACGLSAPSSKNAQPWTFHIVNSSGTLTRIADAIDSGEGMGEYVPHDPRTGAPRSEYDSTVRESARVLRDAGAAVFIENRGIFSGGRQSLIDATPAALRASLMGYSLEMIGLGTAIENMWLAAGAIGLGAAFMGDVAIAEEAIRLALDTPGDIVGALAIGHTDTAPVHPPPPRTEGLVRWHV
jgi:nitroreductase